MCRAMLSRSFIQFSVAGQDCVPSLLFELRLHHGGGNEDHGDLRQKAQCTHYRTQCPQPCGRHCQPTPLLESPGHSQASLVQSPVGSLLLSPRPCCVHGFVCALHASARVSWTLLGKSGSVSCGVTAPFSWVLMCTRFCLCPPRVCFPRHV